MDVVKKLIAVELIIIFVVLTAVLGEMFPPGKPQIRVDGEVQSIPAGSEELGALEGVSHRTAGQPTEDMCGTNLEPRHAGCPLYRDGGREDVIYLYDYAGCFLRFVRQGE